MVDIYVSDNTRLAASYFDSGVSVVFYVIESRLVGGEKCGSKDEDVNKME